MKIIELILDEENEENGISAISLVESPAIEESWIALKNHEVKFAQADNEQRLLVGAALVPEKPIFRKDPEGKEDYYIYFSKETIKKASQLFLIKGNQSNSTLEHKSPLEGLTVVESWLVEDKEKDKSAIYNLDLPVGSWVVSMKVNSDEIWNDYILSGKVRGFSIEAMMTDRAKPKDKSLKEDAKAQDLVSEIKKIVTDNEK